MATTQDDRIAELQRAITELQGKLGAALAQRSSEYGERIVVQCANSGGRHVRWNDATSGHSERA
jgi:hypothetical protein